MAEPKKIEFTLPKQLTPDAQAPARERFQFTLPNFPTPTPPPPTVEPLTEERPGFTLPGEEERIARPGLGFVTIAGIPLDFRPTVEAFQESTKLAQRGLQSAAKFPGISLLTGVEPEGILPNIPKSIPTPFRELLAAGREVGDVAIGAGAFLLGGAGQIASPLAQISAPIEEAGARIGGTPGRVVGRTLGVGAEALLTLGAGTASSLTAQTAKTVGGKVAATVAGKILGTTKPPIAKLPPGVAPIVGKDNEITKRLGKMFVPSFKQDAAFVSMKAEKEGRLILGRMQAQGVFRNLTQTSKRISKETGRSMDDVQAELGLALKGDANVSALAKDAVKPIREQINRLQQEAADLGLVSQELVDETLDTYLSRSYMSKIGGDVWQPADDVVERARAFISENTVVPRKQGGPRPPTPDEVSGQIEKIIQGGETPMFMKKGGGTTRIPLGPTIKRKDIPKPIRELMGEIEEGAMAGAITVDNLRRMNITTRFLKAVSEGSEVVEFGGSRQQVRWVSDTRLPGYTAVNGKAWGALDGKFVLNKYAEDLRDFVEMTQPNRFGSLDKLSSFIMNFFKVSKTVLNPATHMRNVLGNFTFADFADIAPWQPGNWRFYAKASQELLKSGKGFTAQAAKRGATLTPEGVTPLVREAIEHGAIQTEFVANEVLQEVATRFAKLNPMRAVVAIVQKPVKAIGRVYNAEDQIFKLAAFMKRRELGESPREAARFVNTWFPNYRDVSPAVKFLRKSPLGAPFITFTAEATRIFSNAAKQHPVRFTKWMMAPAMFNSAAAAHLGMSDQDLKRVKGQLPKFLDQPFTMMWPIRDDDGNVQIVDGTYIHPLGAFLAAKRTGALDFPLFGEVIANNPMINTALEVGNNIDFFTGRKIVEPGEDPFKERVTKVLKDFGPSLLPEIPGLTTEGGPAAREISKAIRREGGERVPGRFGQERDLKDVLIGELGPVRVVPVDEALKFSKSKRDIAKLRELQRALTKIPREVVEGRISMEEGRDRAARIQKLMRDLQK
jgi:hypothetical protein